MDIEISEEFEFPEVNVKQGHNENMILVTVKFPGNEQKFNIQVPSFHGPALNQDDIMKMISMKLGATSKTMAFLDRMVEENIEEINLPEMIAKSVTMYINKSETIDTINQLSLQIDMSQDFKQPEIDVKPGIVQNTQLFIVKVPGKERKINFDVNVPKQCKTEEIQEICSDYIIDDKALINVLYKKIKMSSKNISELDTSSVLDTIFEEANKTIHN